jgi:HK97 family phage prohead protease
MLRQDNALRVAVAPITHVQVRDASGTGDGSWTIEGYAAVYEQETTLYDIAGWWRVREEISRDAFTDVLARVASGQELVHLNHGHDMKTVMAATDVDGIGGLELSQDFHGLRFFARVDPEDPDAKGLAVKMGRQVVRQSSFAFTIADEELVSSERLDDGTIDELWRINEIGHLYDVCVCAQGAYPQTESHIRSLAAASLRVSDVDALRRTRSRAPQITKQIERAREQRADIAALELLVCAYDNVSDFIAIEDPQADADDIAEAQGILDGLDHLIQVEAAEPNDNADALEDGTQDTGRTHVGQPGRRSRGRSQVAPSRVGEAASGRSSLELLKAHAHAATNSPKRRLT